jgi:hypothetical protein
MNEWIYDIEAWEAAEVAICRPEQRVGVEG